MSHPDFHALEPQAPSWPKILGGIAIGVGLYGLVMHGWGLITAPAAGDMPAAMTALSPEALKDLARYQRVNGIGCLVVGVLLIAGGITLFRKRPIARGLLLTWAVLRISVAGLTAPSFYSYTNSMMSGAIPPAPAPAASASASPAALPGTTANPPLSPASATSAPPTGSTPEAAAAAPPEIVASGPAPGSFTIRPTSPAAPTASPAAPAPPPINLSALMSGIALASFIFGLLLSCLLPMLTLIWFNLPKVRALIDSWSPPPPAPPNVGKLT